MGGGKAEVFGVRKFISALDEGFQPLAGSGEGICRGRGSYWFFGSEAPKGRHYVSLGQRPRNLSPKKTQGLKARPNAKTMPRPFRACWL